MKNMLAISLFMLAMLAWAAAQQPGSAAPQPSTPGGASQAGSQGQGANALPVTEGCLGGSNPNYTITDKTGVIYKLNIPPNADASKLASHVGESVQVLGNVKDTAKAGDASIDVQRVGRGTGQCPGSGSKGAPSPPKQ